MGSYGTRFLAGLLVSIAASLAAVLPAGPATPAQTAAPPVPGVQAPVSICGQPDAVCADFHWHVGDRFISVWRSWGSVRHPLNYDPAVLHRSYFLTLDACRSTGGGRPVVLYSWVIRGVSIPGFSRSREVATCELNIQVPAEGSYEAALTVRTQDGRTATTQQSLVLKDWLIVSIGDSYASGEGNPDVPARSAGEPEAWQDRRCHRSMMSGPAQAALELERRDPHSTVTFLSYACSGAKIRKGLTGPYAGLLPDWPPIPPQLRAAATLFCGDDLCDRPEDPTIDVLLISIGGNDVGFSNTIAACAARLDDFADRTFQAFLRIDFVPQKDCHQQPRLTRLLEARFQELPGLYQEVQEEIRRRLKVASVYITEYPSDIFDSRNGCRSLQLVTAAEAQWLASQGRRLNQIIHRTWQSRWVGIGNDQWKRDRRWDVIAGIAAGFAGNGYCATPTYIGHLGQSITRQLDYLGFLHPNGEGHRVYQQAILRKLQEAAQEEVITFPRKRVMVTFEAIRVVDGTPMESRVPAFPSPANPLLIHFQVGGASSVFRQETPLDEWVLLPTGQYVFSPEVGHPDAQIDVLVRTKLPSWGDPQDHIAGASRELSLFLSLGRDGNFGAGGPRQVTSRPKNRSSLSVRYRVDVLDLR